jgi:hypothetical protein
VPDGLLPDEGIGAQCEYILKRSIAGVLPWQLIYFVNDIVPTSATVLDDLEEASWGGYTRLTLDRDQWQTPTVHSGCAHSTWGTDAQVWFVTGGPTQTNYGYAYIDFTAGVIRFIQRFDDADIEAVTVGGKVSILPAYTLTSAACP